MADNVDEYPIHNEEHRMYSYDEMADAMAELEIAHQTIKNQAVELEYLRSKPTRTSDDDIMIKAAIEALNRMRAYFESVPERIIRSLVVNQNLNLKDSKERMKLYKFLTKELDASKLLKPSALLRAIGAD